MEPRQLFLLLHVILARFFPLAKTEQIETLKMRVNKSHLATNCGDTVMTKSGARAGGAIVLQPLRIATNLKRL